MFATRVQLTMSFHEAILMGVPKQRENHYFLPFPTLYNGLHWESDIELSVPLVRVGRFLNPGTLGTVRFKSIELHIDLLCSSMKTIGLTLSEWQTEISRHVIDWFPGSKQKRSGRYRTLYRSNHLSEDNNFFTFWKVDSGKSITVRQAVHVLLVLGPMLDQKSVCLKKAAIQCSCLAGNGNVCTRIVTKNFYAEPLPLLMTSHLSWSVYLSLLILTFRNQVGMVTMVTASVPWCHLGAVKSLTSCRTD